MSTQFGLFTEFEWMAGHSEQEAFCTSLAQIDEAERLDFDSVWRGEIHFQKGRSVLPSPLYDEIYEQQAIYGTPQEAIAKIRWLQADFWPLALADQEALRAERLMAFGVAPS